MGSSYTQSELKALKLGFRQVDDSNAYNGRYFIKNNLIWIHKIGALMNRLGIDEDGLRIESYDVDSYYKYNHWTEFINR